MDDLESLLSPETLEIGRRIFNKPGICETSGQHLFGPWEPSLIGGWRCACQDCGHEEYSQVRWFNPTRRTK